MRDAVEGSVVGVAVDVIAFDYGVVDTWVKFNAFVTAVADDVVFDVYI